MFAVMVHIFSILNWLLHHSVNGKQFFSCNYILTLKSVILQCICDNSNAIHREDFDHERHMNCCRPIGSGRDKNNLLGTIIEKLII